MAPYKYMKFKSVIVLVLISFVLSVAAMPIYNAGVALWDRQQFYEAMRTDPAYEVRNDIELQYPHVIVLAVASSPELTQVWITFNTPVTQTEGMTAIAYAAVAVGEAYSSAQYVVVPAQIDFLRTIDKLTTYIYGTQAFLFTREAITLLNADPCDLCVLSSLLQTGQVQQIPLRGATCPEILRREPDYVWPWE